MTQLECQIFTLLLKKQTNKKQNPKFYTHMLLMMIMMTMMMMCVCERETERNSDRHRER